MGRGWGSSLRTGTIAHSRFPEAGNCGSEEGVPSTLQSSWLLSLVSRFLKLTHYQKLPRVVLQFVALAWRIPTSEGMLLSLRGAGPRRPALCLISSRPTAHNTDSMF